MAGASRTKTANSAQAWLGALLVVILLGSSGCSLPWQSDGPCPTCWSLASLRAQVLDAAKSDYAAMANLDYRAFDQGLQQMFAATTPAYQDANKARWQGARLGWDADRFSVKLAGAQFGFGRFSPAHDEVPVLVFADTMMADDILGPSPVAHRDTRLLDMKLVGGKWLINGMEVIPVSGDPTLGGTDAGSEVKAAVAASSAAILAAADPQGTVMETAVLDVSPPAGTPNTDACTVTVMARLLQSPIEGGAGIQVTAVMHHTKGMWALASFQKQTEVS